MCYLAVQMRKMPQKIQPGSGGGGVEGKVNFEPTTMEAKTA